MTLQIQIFKNKKVLITGHTGFKGTWLSLWMILIGAKVYGISDIIYENNILFKLIKKKFQRTILLDVSDYKKFTKNIAIIKPDFIFHLAAQSIVGKSYDQPLKTIMSNTIGTINLLDFLSQYKSKCTCILVTSDKCYKNFELNRGYKENDMLGGKDLYSASKAMAEIAFSAYYESKLINNKNLKIASARAGNVIGGNDWNKDRIIPDLIKSSLYKKILNLRNPRSTRPWQFVLEPIGGYISLAIKLNTQNATNGQSYNFGPSKKSNIDVENVVKEFQKYFADLKYKANNTNFYFESNLLALNCSKAKKELDWTSKLSFLETVKLTSEWYLSFSKKPDQILDFSINQIKNYQNKL